eukprot:1427107-Rhodomonas_salina.1
MRALKPLISERGAGGDRERAPHVRASPGPASPALSLHAFPALSLHAFAAQTSPCRLWHREAKRHALAPSVHWEGGRVDFGRWRWAAGGL